MLQKHFYKLKDIIFFLIREANNINELIQLLHFDNLFLISYHTFGMINNIEKAKQQWFPEHITHITPLVPHLLDLMKFKFNEVQCFSRSSLNII